jgi:uncharacterized protein YrrD
MDDFRFKLSGEECNNLRSKNRRQIGAVQDICHMLLPSREIYMLMTFMIEKVQWREHVYKIKVKTRIFSMGFSSKNSFFNVQRHFL